ncbi:peptidoglycan-binding domain-containing protein [Thalassobacillus hwangdonensis]|uniref:Peptidoglycan-binding domain-containing protein n=1 Tax=Thalassobacillus hwangdonensis TaxID=546108 RepID=A0ABW3L405_9BACI
MASDTILASVKGDPENHALSSVLLEEGMTDWKIIELKMKLNWLGFGRSKLTSKFGEYFRAQVEHFQDQYKLPISGVIDETTHQKITNEFFNTYRDAAQSDHIKELLKALKKLGFIDKFEDPSPAELKNHLIDFQLHYGLEASGVFNEATFKTMAEILSSPLQEGKKGQEILRLKKLLNDVGYGRIKLTTKFGKLAEQKLTKFQEDYGLPISGIADELTLAKLEKALKVKERLIYKNYPMTLQEVMDSRQSKGIIDKDALLIDPNKSINDTKKKYLFLDLSQTNATTAHSLNKLLESNDILARSGKKLLEVANSHNLNVIFLLMNVYEALEANEVENSSLDRVINKIAEELKQRSNSDNNTLYKLYCHPEQGQEGTFDSEWILNQVEVLYHLYNELGEYILGLEIPVYKNLEIDKYIRG